jgi:hypothetical protein
VYKSQETRQNKGRKTLSFWLSLAFSAVVEELVWNSKQNGSSNYEPHPVK